MEIPEMLDELKQKALKDGMLAPEKILFSNFLIC